MFRLRKISTQHALLAEAPLPLANLSSTRSGTERSTGP